MFFYSLFVSYGNKQDRIGNYNTVGPITGQGYIAFPPLRETIPTDVYPLTSGLTLYDNIGRFQKIFMFLFSIEHLNQ